MPILTPILGLFYGSQDSGAETQGKQEHRKQTNGMDKNGGKDWAKARAGSHGWVTRSAKSLREACTEAHRPFAQIAASKMALEAAVSDFDRHLDNFEKVQG
jgi:hypothetical protein